MVEKATEPIRVVTEGQVTFFRRLDDLFTDRLRCMMLIPALDSVIARTLPEIPQPISTARP